MKKNEKSNKKYGGYEDAMLKIQICQLIVTTVALLVQLQPYIKI